MKGFFKITIYHTLITIALIAGENKCALALAFQDLGRYILNTKKYLI